jgi:uncharacterized coiled-coil DUF342 family protein
LGSAFDIEPIVNLLLEVSLESQDNQIESFIHLETLMNALTGMEKFSHLEDKIYLTIEFAKKMREERDRLEREAQEMRRETAAAVAEKQILEEKLSALLSERDTIQLKVEAMLDAITAIDTEVAEAIGR